MEKELQMVLKHIALHITETINIQSTFAENNLNNSL